LGTSANSIQQFWKIDAGRFGGLGQQAGRGHARAAMRVIPPEAVSRCTDKQRDLS
jgi:hypothetical protein